MIQINFKQDSFDTFLSKIEPEIIKKFDSILATTSNEEQTFLRYLKNDIGLEKILSAKPKEFNTIANLEEMSSVKNQIKQKTDQLKLSITTPITTKDLKQYLTRYLTIEKLREISRIHSIKLHGASKKDDLIKIICNHTFNPNNKISFQKEYFIYRTEQLCKDIFADFYLSDWDEIGDYNKYTFVQSLDLKSCPYCNRNYIFTVVNGKIRPEIDHFYPKSLYPYFAMSYFNLIPSCPTCNHTKSNTFHENMVNPYSTFIQNTKIDFSLDIQNNNFLNIKKDKYDFCAFDIVIKSTDNKNIEVFKLQELYKEHKDVVVDLLLKYKYYPSQYISYLRSYGFSEDEIYRYLFNNFVKNEDLHKRPLSKLTKDIAKELKLISVFE